MRGLFREEKRKRTYPIFGGLRGHPVFLPEKGGYFIARLASQRGSDVLANRKRRKESFFIFRP